MMALDLSGEAVLPVTRVGTALAAGDVCTLPPQWRRVWVRLVDTADGQMECGGATSEPVDLDHSTWTLLAERPAQIRDFTIYSGSASAPYHVKVD